MDQETEALMTELHRLFGRLRYALIEAQTAMAQIAGKAQNPPMHGKGRDESPVDDGIKGSLPRTIP